ncbi:hypothetical protein B0T25DRAFT_583685 [Lasiosphaeria hispida]|uniref:Uncharacterized protein n=1 Tax=Lasiosphaeria hispida TaxID=260671 RepID=A0AAJ0HBE5_9PEZI|nr:hypothetical protein B0T25DRAFT_583685 [Lasiosphaeria hispida]
MDHFSYTAPPRAIGDDLVPNDGAFNDEQADEFFQYAGLSAKEKLASLIYNEELGAIERATPFREVNADAVIEIPLFDSEVDPDLGSDEPPEDEWDAPSPAARRASDPCSDSDEPDAVKARSLKRRERKRPAPGAGPVKPAEVQRDPVVVTAPKVPAIARKDGEPSGPTGMRFSLARLRSVMLDLEAEEGVDKFELRYASEITASRIDLLEPADRAAATHSRSFLSHIQYPSLFNGPCWTSRDIKLSYYKGFPLVEHVVFAVHSNDWSGNFPQVEAELNKKKMVLRKLREYNETWEDLGHPNGLAMPKLVRLMNRGENYWTAVALLVYGDAAQWLRVKAEHLYLLRTILESPSHPRYQFYAHRNKFAVKTKVMSAFKPNASGNPEVVINSHLNWWEVLHIEGAPVLDDDMAYLTADLYKIFIVLYKRHVSEFSGREGKIYNMKAYGEPNSRHVFLLKEQDEFFRPMVPNNYDATKFRLPHHIVWPSRYLLAFETPPPAHSVLAVDSQELGLDNYAAASLPWPRFNAAHLRYAVTYPPFSRERLRRRNKLADHQAADFEEAAEDPEPDDWRLASAYGDNDSAINEWAPHDSDHSLSHGPGLDDGEVFTIEDTDCEESEDPSAPSQPPPAPAQRGRPAEAKGKAKAATPAVRRPARRQIRGSSPEEGGYEAPARAPKTRVRKRDDMDSGEGHGESWARARKRAKASEPSPSPPGQDQAYGVREGSVQLPGGGEIKSQSKSWMMRHLVAELRRWCAMLGESSAENWTKALCVEFLVPAEPRFRVDAHNVLDVEAPGPYLFVGPDFEPRG